MFDHLIESQRHATRRQGLGSRAASLVIHTVVIAAAAYATLNAGQGNTAVKADTTVLIFDRLQPRKPPEPRPALPDVPLKVLQTAVVPDEIPTKLPTVDVRPLFDPRDYLATRQDDDVASDPVRSDIDVFSDAIVEEKPLVLSGSPPAYPELLKRAGIQGRVVVQAVIDTLGRAEAASVKILQSSHPGFDQSAMNYVLKAVLRPARVHGRAVRVLINIPIEYRITEAQ
jgi:periplasmic protein TonB